MVEVAMVRRMTVRGLLLAPALVVPLWIMLGPRHAWSAAVGLGMTLLNLWMSARIIGAVAERTPQLLLPVGLATFALGLIVLTGIALTLTAADAVEFPVTGLVLIGSHLGLVLWEGTHAYDNIEQGQGATR